MHSTVVSSLCGLCRARSVNPATSVVSPMLLSSGSTGDMQSRLGFPLLDSPFSFPNVQSVSENKCQKVNMLVFSFPSFSINF